MKINYYKLIILAGFISVIALSGCKDDITPSLIEIQTESGPAPVIASLTPSTEAIAGVTKITIDGSNFSATIENNFVYFNGTPATIVSASPNQLIVIPPKSVVNDAVEIKISKLGADEFGNVITNYKLKPALIEIKSPAGVEIFDKNRLAYGITTDGAGNLYVSAKEFNVGAGIKKISPAGEITNYAPKGGETFFANLKYGPGGVLYASRVVGTSTAFFQINEGETPKVFVTSSAGFGIIADFDFDMNTNIWAGGSGNGFIYSITPAKEVNSFEFNEDVQSVRVFNNAVYLLSTTGGSQSIWRFPINSALSVGAAEKYFDVTGNLPPNIVASQITFSADGDLYIGTNYKDAIFVVHQDKSFENLYPGVIEPSVYSFSWGPGNFLYYTKLINGSDIQTVFKIDMEKLGAPQYGRD